MDKQVQIPSLAQGPDAHAGLQRYQPIVSVE